MYTYLKKNERKALFMRRFIVIIAGAAAAFSLFLFSGNKLHTTAQVEASAAYDTEVYYKSVRIDAGDTLWDLADEYMSTSYDSKEDFITEVKEINHITDQDLQAGSYIIIPYTVMVE